MLVMHEMAGVRYDFICHLNDSQVIQLLHTGIRCKASSSPSGDGRYSYMFNNALSFYG